MGIVDIKSAYRAVSIHPSNTKYLGLRWELNGENIYMEDSRLCFGQSMGPMAFDSISNVVYLVLTYIYIYILQAVNYLDDFVIAHTKEEAHIAQTIELNYLDTLVYIYP